MCLGGGAGAAASKAQNTGPQAGTARTCTALALVRAADHQDGAVTSHDLPDVACGCIILRQGLDLAAGASDAIGQAAGKVDVGPPDKRLQAVARDSAGWQAWNGFEQLYAAVLSQGHQDTLPAGVISHPQAMLTLRQAS